MSGGSSSGSGVAVALGQAHHLKSLPKLQTPLIFTYFIKIVLILSYIYLDFILIFIFFSSFLAIFRLRELLKGLTLMVPLHVFNR